MELKLFGKSIFEFNKNRGSIYWENSNNQLKKSSYLPDFYTLGIHINEVSEFIVVPDGATGRAVAVPIKHKQANIKLTPKGLFEMKALNTKSFKLNVCKKYLDDQIQQFKDKLGIIKIAEGDFTRGVTEISSILIRLENRKKYSLFREFFDQYPYTTTSKIDEVLKSHNYLKIGTVNQFLADMPKEAITEMKKYDSKTKDLCNKKPIFYIVADKKDFEKTTKRRDPILLAQSPFGHIWQILGVWDKEMLLLEEL